MGYHNSLLTSLQAPILASIHLSSTQQPNEFHLQHRLDHNISLPENPSVALLHTQNKNSLRKANKVQLHQGPNPASLTSSQIFAITPYESLQSSYSGLLDTPLNFCAYSLCLEGSPPRILITNCWASFKHMPQMLPPLGGLSWPAI